MWSVVVRNWSVHALTGRSVCIEFFSVPWQLGPDVVRSEEVNFWVVSSGLGRF